jgi:hypothetical protein
VSVRDSFALGTALDLDGGRVASVNYNFDAGIDRRLKALRQSLGPSTTRSQLLTALRGARVEAKSRARQVTADRHGGGAGCG